MQETITHKLKMQRTGNGYIDIPEHIDNIISITKENGKELKNFKFVVDDNKLIPLLSEGEYIGSEIIITYTSKVKDRDMKIDKLI